MQLKTLHTSSARGFDYDVGRAVLLGDDNMNDIRMFCIVKRQKK